MLPFIVKLVADVVWGGRRGREREVRKLNERRNGAENDGLGKGRNTGGREASEKRRRGRGVGARRREEEQGRKGGTRRREEPPVEVETSLGIVGMAVVVDLCRRRRRREKGDRAEGKREDPSNRERGAAFLGATFHSKLELQASV
jgi:hypothetical protein